MKAHLLALALFLVIPLFYTFALFFPYIGIGILLSLIIGSMYYMALIIVKMYLEDKNNDRTR